VFKYLRLMMFEKALRVLVSSGGRLNYAIFSCRRDGKVASIEVLAGEGSSDVWLGIQIRGSECTDLKVIEKLRNFINGELKKQVYTVDCTWWVRVGVDEAVVIIEKAFINIYELPENYEPTIELHVDGVGDFIIDKYSMRRVEALSVNLLSYYDTTGLKNLRVTEEFLGSIRKSDIDSIRFRSGVRRAVMDIFLRNGQVIKYVIPKKSVIEYKRKLIALGYRVFD